MRNFIRKSFRFLNIWRAKCPDCEGTLHADCFDTIIDTLVWTCNKCGSKFK